MLLVCLLLMLLLTHISQFISVLTSVMASYFCTSLSWPWSLTEAPESFWRESCVYFTASVSCPWSHISLAVCHIFSTSLSWPQRFIICHFGMSPHCSRWAETNDCHYLYICSFIYNTIQYNGEFALKNWQTNCQFNLAHKLKRTETFKRKMNYWEILRIEIVLNVKMIKFKNMTEVKTTKIWKKNWKGKK